MSVADRLLGFRRLVADHLGSGHFHEERDGTLRLWRDLSPQGKLNSLARGAALYDVPHEEFAAAVREAAPEAGAAALRLALDNARDLRELEGMLPDDGRTEATPLVERFREALAPPAEAPDPAPARRRGREIDF